jgi:hypothetical protein
VKAGEERVFIWRPGAFSTQSGRRQPGVREWTAGFPHASQKRLLVR